MSSSNAAAAAAAAAHGRLDQAAVKAAELVQAFASVDDPYSSSDENPWKYPDQIFQQLRAARDDLLDAWKELERQQQPEDDGTKNSEPSSSLDPERCRALYMDMITDAFADTLENMRNVSSTEDRPLDLDVLVDCLQSGIELLTNQEQEALFSSEEDEEGGGEDMDMETEVLTPHERHRRKMGLDVAV